MNIFQFLIYLGIINIVFGFVWKWLFALPGAIIFTALNFDRGILLLKALGAYMLISLVSFLTLIASQDTESVWYLLFFTVVGAFVLFMSFASNAYEQRKQASLEYDFQMMSQIERNAWFDAILMFSSPAIFVIILFAPAIAANPLNVWLFDLVMWAYDLPFIGWLIGIGGILFMLGIIWQGIIMTVMLCGLAYTKLKVNSNS